MADKSKNNAAENVSGVFEPSSNSAFSPGILNRSLPEEGSAPKTKVTKISALTILIKETFTKCNPGFRPIEKLPQRILTQPFEGVLNGGIDNEEANLICRVHDQIQNDTITYTILDLLGTGTFGQVFRCQNEVTKSLVAIKVIKNKTAYHAQGALEIKIVKLLNNSFDPNDQRHIVRLLDHFEFKGHICVVFELLNMSLLDILTQNQFRGLPLSVVQRFTQQIVTSLFTLQEANVIHCDLKPENILLCPQRKESSNSNFKSGVGGSEGDSSDAGGQNAQIGVWSDIKVIDFGSACYEGRTMYSYIQSRFYRSPEVLLGVPYNGAIDMWSLACVCAEMYLGLPLFPGISQHNQLTRIVEMFGLPPDYLIEGKHGLKYFSRVSPSAALAQHPDSQQPVQQYRIKTGEEYAAETNTEVPVLKKYLRYSRLEEVIMKCPLANKSRMTTEQKRAEMHKRQCFLNFLEGLFCLDPFSRWTPKQVAGHPFITGAAYTGSYIPSVDATVNERKLSFMLWQQRNGSSKGFDVIHPPKAQQHHAAAVGSGQVHISSHQPGAQTGTTHSHAEYFKQHQQQHQQVSNSKMFGAQPYATGRDFLPLSRRLTEPTMVSESAHSSHKSNSSQKSAGSQNTQSRDTSPVESNKLNASSRYQNDGENEARSLLPAMTIRQGVSQKQPFDGSEISINASALVDEMARTDLLDKADVIVGTSLPPTTRLQFSQFAPQQQQQAMATSQKLAGDAVWKNQSDISYYSAVGDGMAGSLGSNSFGTHFGGSLPDNSLTLTDFGQALLRPDMDESRMLQSQQNAKSPLMARSHSFQAIQQAELRQPLSPHRNVSDPANPSTTGRHLLPSRGRVGRWLNSPSHEEGAAGATGTESREPYGSMSTQAAWRSEHSAPYTPYQHSHPHPPMSSPGPLSPRMEGAVATGSKSTSPGSKEISPPISVRSNLDGAQNHSSVSLDAFAGDANDRSKKKNKDPNSDPFFNYNI